MALRDPHCPNSRMLGHFYGTAIPHVRTLPIHRIPIGSLRDRQNQPGWVMGWGVVCVCRRCQSTGASSSTRAGRGVPRVRLLWEAECIKSFRSDRRMDYRRAHTSRDGGTLELAIISTLLSPLSAQGASLLALRNLLREATVSPVLAHRFSRGRDKPGSPTILFGAYRFCLHV